MLLKKEWWSHNSDLPYGRNQNETPAHILWEPLSLLFSPFSFSSNDTSCFAHSVQSYKHKINFSVWVTNCPTQNSCISQFLPASKTSPEKRTKHLSPIQFHSLRLRNQKKAEGALNSPISRYFWWTESYSSHRIERNLFLSLEAASTGSCLWCSFGFLKRKEETALARYPELGRMRLIVIASGIPM